MLQFEDQPAETSLFSSENFSAILKSSVSTQNPYLVCSYAHRCIWVIFLISKLIAHSLGCSLSFLFYVTECWHQLLVFILTYHQCLRSVRSSRSLRQSYYQTVSGLHNVSPCSFQKFAKLNPFCFMDFFLLLLEQFQASWYLSA